MRSWRDSFVALDTETTGFGPTARVLEVAVIAFEGGVVAEEWSTLLNPPDVDWTSEKVQKALEVNHIKREDLLGKPTFEQILPDLAVKLAHTTWVAHNMSFDFGMLEQEFRFAAHMLDAPALKICTCTLAAYFSPHAKGNKLYDVATRYGVLQSSAHRAAVDAVVCGNILTRIAHHVTLPDEAEAMADICKKADTQWKQKTRRW